MKILFPCIKNKISGPEKWREGLVKSLLEKNGIEGNEITEIYSNSLKSLLNIKKILQVKIIHSYDQSLGTLLILLFGKILRKKIIHTVHGDYYKEQKSKTGMRKLVWLFANRMCTYFADKITFPSQYLFQEIIKKEPYLKGKSVVIPNGINIRQIKTIKGYIKKDLGLENEMFLILEVTNFNLKEKAKGIDLLIKKFRVFNEEVRDSVLFIVGGGRLLNQYKHKYQTKNIRFLGFRQDVIKLIKVCDIFVHSTFLDNFPYVILEAMICEKPIITFNIGGIFELVDNGAIIIDPFNVDNFEKDMMKIYRNKKLREDLVKKALQRIRFYDWRIVSKSFINLYKEILLL